MEQVVIVFADKEAQIEENEEFVELIKACDMQIVETFQQMLKSISFRTYIGSGKCEEIREYIEEHEVERVVFNHDLSPLQIRNLEEILLIPVMDRTELILEIFKSRATTPTSKLQVESATLQKLLPRLVGANAQLGRQSGSGKNKGTGEKQLEIDRRRIKSRMHEVKRELKEVEAQRATQRRARQRNHIPLVALVGYTNAGKSTIMNMLLKYSNQKEEKHVMEKDMLFATLDTSVRNINLTNGKSFLLSDTVGFVSNLPHSLIKAFHSTLEEVKYADLLLQIVDASSEEMHKQMQVTEQTLKEIHAADLPMITVYNKCDKTKTDDNQEGYHYPYVKEHEIYMSAKEQVGIEELLMLIHSCLHPDELTVHMILPYKEASIYSFLMEYAHVHTRIDHEDGIHLKVTLEKKYYEKYKAFVIEIES